MSGAAAGRADPRTLWRLARPAGMPLVLALPAVGFGFGHWEWALHLRAPLGLLGVLVAWFWLSAGTLWLNAALDRDEGDLLMGGPAPVPVDLPRWGYAALGLSVASAALAGPVPAACAAGCALLAVAYSHPRLAWKGHPVLGPAVNLLGYGVLSPMAGWSVVHTEPTARTPFALALLVCWVGATYFGAQAFQQVEDAGRGYRTLVVTHGPWVTIAVARAGYALAFWGAVALAAAGWFPRLLVAAAPSWWVLDRHLAAWGRRPELGAEAGREMLRRAAALAAAVMFAVTVQHLWHVIGGAPPAGLGTAWRPR